MSLDVPRLLSFPEVGGVSSPLGELDGVRTIDRSLIRKLELHGPTPGTLGTATCDDAGVWTCPVTPMRTLVLGGDGPLPADAIDLTCAYAALELVGPDANERLARFCAIRCAAARDAGRGVPSRLGRPHARVRPANSRPDALLLLVGWALGQYLREVVEACVRSSVRARMLGAGGGDLRDSYDVVIVGGGAHGLATAYYLGQLGVKNVAVLEEGVHRLGRGRS